MSATSVMFTLSQAQPWLEGARLIGDGLVGVTRVHSDTRTLQPGDLFVALKGERFDANQFLVQARAAGAAAALCSDEAALRASGLPGLLVQDSRRGLGQLAAGWRARFRLPVIAVTGSNGKTTVTQMIAAILRAWKPQATLATEGNLNNDIGVPLMLLRLRAAHEVAVLELGMNHPGEIAELATMVRPTVALVNNAQREHLEFMATVEAVARENGSVIAALGETGTAVFPQDDDYTGLWQALTGARAQLHFAIDAGPTQADVGCVVPSWDGAAWQVLAHTPAGVLSYALRVAGLHNVKNSLAAAACALAVGVPLTHIAQGLRNFEPVRGRSRVLQLRCADHGFTLVDDSYNANPDSVRAAIDMLAALPAPRVLVLGDMAEVGDRGQQFHAEIGQYASERGIDQLLTHGVLARAATQACGAAQHFDDMAELQAAVLAQLPKAGAVLVKGSRFMRMERVVDAVCTQAQTNTENIHG